jgi:hypothetical protein
LSVLSRINADLSVKQLTTVLPLAGKSTMSVITMKAKEPKDEPAQHCSTASEQSIVESSATVFCEGTVELKGLPSQHVRAYCMGGYVKQDCTLSGRLVYVGGRDGDMTLCFDNSKTGWKVTHGDKVDGGGFAIYASDSAINPNRITAPWEIVGKQPAPSLRVRRFGGRDTILEVSGLPSAHNASDCMGRYTQETCNHNEKPTYKGSRRADGKAIWFSEGRWCVGPKEHIGTTICSICVKHSARTPDAVQSTWRVSTGRAVYDERIQVCGASAQQHPSATGSHQQAQRSSASQSSAPPKLAVIGSKTEGESADGTYTKLQREVGSRVVYKGGRNGKQAIWYLQSGTWVVRDVEDVGTPDCCMYTSDLAFTPDAVTELWSLPLMVPCSTIRVTKSKKKHTKVIEVKGALELTRHKGVADDKLVVANGRYRQQARIMSGRPTFKGGRDGMRAFWYDESYGKWRGGFEHAVGTGICDMEATDSASTPNAVKAVWYVLDEFKPSPYPNVIVPSIEAAEQEVPRLVQLKMCELMAAQHRRCLGCGHEYTAQAEVVFQMKCMHHHCMCCEEELGNGVCIVCAEEGGG